MKSAQVQNEILAFRRDPRVRQIVIELSKVEPTKQFMAIAFDWVIILGLAMFCHAHFNVGLYLFTSLLIAGRQHALLAIMHEAAHFRISKKPWLNDFLGNYLAAYPILMTLEAYRATHGAHHSDLNTDRDPDWVRKIKLQEWHYPKSSAQASYVLARQLWVGGYEWMVLMYNLTKNNFKKITFYFVVAIVILSLGMGSSFLLYWIAPLLTLFPLMQRVRSIAEHFSLPYEHDMNETRNVLSGPIESFFFGPHNINIHLAHHIFPTVPHYNLKKLHQRLCEFKVYSQYAHNNDSYFVSGHSVWSDLTRKKESNSENKNIAA